LHQVRVRHICFVIVVIIIQSNQSTGIMYVRSVTSQLNVAKEARVSSELRIGIYSGTFDPVHSGHISFALQALKTAHLDKIYFLPERLPRYKPSVEHYGHRVAMLRRALAPYPKLSILELEDHRFSVRRTLNKIRQHLPNSQLVLMVGSDVVFGFKDWPDINELMTSCELIVGLRGQQPTRNILETFTATPLFPKKLTLLTSAKPHVSSRRIRHAISQGMTTAGLLTSVHGYARSQWLYVSVSNE
jgi:nicotinate-nucleotide adenylyltransferase